MVRREAEQCDKIKDFIINRCSYGGSGAGIPGELSDNIKVHFSKSNTIANNIVPPPSMSGANVIAHLNHALSVPEPMDNSNDLNLINENKSLKHMQKS